MSNSTNSNVFKRLFKNPQAVFAISFLTLVTLAAIFAPLLTSHTPGYASLRSILAAPGTNGHLLGGDSAGRDVFARLLFGGRNTLLGALLGTTVAVSLGTLTGLIAGYFGKWFDTLGTAATSILQALPGMVVLIAARTIIGPNMWAAMLIYGILFSASVFRLVRQTVQSVRNELYVDAARVSGLTDTRIIFRHVLRVVRAPIIIQAGFIAMIALGIQAGLEILGLGDLTMVTWGAMLNDGFSRIFQQPLLVVWPGAMLALVCLSLTLLGNALRDVLQGADSKRRRPVPASVSAMPDAADSTLSIVPDENTLLQVDNLRIGYAMPDGTTKEIVHGISFAVSRGEVVGLIGESGSGKTQTAFGVMRLLSQGGGIIGGRVLWQGSDLAVLSEKEMAAVRGKRIAYIPQEPMSNLDPSFTVGQQLVEPMRHHLGLSKAEAKARALELLDRVGINNPERVFKSYPHEVSGGMAQRVLIAGAISCNPDLLIADEPTTALDVTVQAEILDLLRSLQAELNVGVLLVTHNFGVVADVCDRVIVMKDGEIVERGETRSIFEHREHQYTRQLFGAILSPDQVRDAYVAPNPTSVSATEELELVA